jgi:DNA-3-methyladenine glycosylase II
MTHSISLDIEAALAKADPCLARAMDAVIARQGRVRIAPSCTPPFEALVRAVVYQSISGKVAAVIFSRLKQAMGDPITPEKILRVSSASIHAVGLSNAKTNTIQNLATWFTANRKTAVALPQQTDDAIVQALKGIAGIGTWTINVLLIFNLGRLDVLPAGDIGIRRGVQLIYGLGQVASATMVREKAELWRPYRSIASMYVWRAMKLKLGPEDIRKEANDDHCSPSR